MIMPRIPKVLLHVLVPLIPFLILSSPAQGAEGKAYGKPMSGTDTVKISVLMANPDDYLGKTVRIEGLITAVCPKRGCWMTLASDEEFENLRVKVDDGVIVFPVEAKGKRAVAEGVFTRVEMDMEQTLAYKKHHAEEHGEEFDPETVKEPMAYYQIQATGALIH